MLDNNWQCNQLVQKVVISCNEVDLFVLTPSSIPRILVPRSSTSPPAKGRLSADLSKSSVYNQFMGHVTGQVRGKNLTTVKKQEEAVQSMLYIHERSAEGEFFFSGLEEICRRIRCFLFWFLSVFSFQFKNIWKSRRRPIFQDFLYSKISKIVNFPVAVFFIRKSWIRQEVHILSFTIELK